MKARVFRWRDGLAVRIPKRVAKQAMLEDGDWVQIEVFAERHLKVRRKSNVPSLSELVAKIAPGNQYPEL
jgi:antitoxin component of MazEF toxin-antitoxin module